MNSLIKAAKFWNPAINYPAIAQDTPGRFKIDQTVVSIRAIALVEDYFSQ